MTLRPAEKERLIKFRGYIERKCNVAVNFPLCVTSNQVEPWTVAVLLQISVTSRPHQVMGHFPHRRSWWYSYTCYITVACKERKLKFLLHGLLFYQWEVPTVAARHTPPRLFKGVFRDGLPLPAWLGRSNELRWDGRSKGFTNALKSLLWKS
jgi:hypothetical protein